ncbi:MAG: nucleoside-diphosphate kinase, partial [Gammaproteobacteria bacterium]|nr:nucleoside-diphosphate kinase [Gammaproteobacteria bacterium]
KQKSVIGKIFNRFETNNLKIVALKMIHLTRQQAEDFYQEHSNKPFFENLCSFMSSSAICVQVLEGENAILLNRKIMGATNPEEAEIGTIRADFGDSLDANAVHGSDSLDSARREVAFFFKADEIFPQT